MRTLLATAAACGLTATAMGNTHSAVVTFDNGWEGWNGTQGPGGSSVIEQSGGNPGAYARTIFNNFGIEWWTNTNQDFLGDFTQYSSVTVSVDVKVNNISFFGTPAPRNLILDLRSFSQAPQGYPFASVWYTLTEMQSGQDWSTYSVTFDPNATDKPDGWGGYGAEDPNTFEPKLPENLTFADIMSSVEEMAFTTYEPGWMYGFTDFDIGIDNIRIDATLIPAPSAALAILGLAGLAAGRRRRN